MHNQFIHRTINTGLSIGLGLSLLPDWLAPSSIPGLRPLRWTCIAPVWCPTKPFRTTVT